mmetsp:Transcript_12535/g.19188  ORF Transcript_12535/g.19188 Transcript_12535/m.19188 type:complete len:130 (+) Transcript_12535:687-1076(+)
MLLWQLHLTPSRCFLSVATIWRVLKPCRKLNRKTGPMLFRGKLNEPKPKKPFFTTLQPLSTEEEEIMRTVNVGSVTWVGANGPPKEEDLSFSWLNPKKEDPPAQIQANKIIENELHDSETIVQHLEEVL